MLFFLLSVSKIIEVFFVINPSVQDRTGELFAKFISHPICEEHLPSALMRFYTGRNNDSPISKCKVYSKMHFK